MGMLNITSLPKHIDEIRILLTDQCLDVLALNETRLDDNISNEDIHIDSYDLGKVEASVCMLKIPIVFLKEMI